MPRHTEKVVKAQPKAKGKNGESSHSNGKQTKKRKTTKDKVEQRSEEATNQPDVDEGRKQTKLGTEENERDAHITFSEDE